MSGIMQMVSSFKSAAGGGGRSPNTLAPVFCCGFECGQFGNVGQHWTTNANASISTSTTRTGSRSLRVNMSANVGAVVANALTSATHYVIRVYLRFATLPSANTFLVYLQDNSSIRYGLAFKSSDSSLYCAQGATAAFGASGVSVTTGTWYRVDLHINFTSGAQTIDAEVDGSALGQKTSATSNSFDSIRLGSAQTCTMDTFFDDFLCSNTVADYPLGAGSVQHFIPVSDGSHNITNAGDFTVGAGGANITNSTTDSYQYIDDVPLNDTTATAGDFIAQTPDTGGGSEYVEHLFGPASGISTPVAGPRAVEVIIGRHQASASSGNSTAKLNDNGTENSYDAFSAVGAASLKYARKHYANAPSDSNAWGVAAGAGNFNNLKHRWGYSSDALPDQYIDCVMIEAEFA